MVVVEEDLGLLISKFLYRNDIKHVQTINYLLRKNRRKLSATANLAPGLSRDC